MSIKAADVAKLRTITGAGMMDCKKALTEASGDFDRAAEIIREKGKAIASKRSDREASEGVVLAKLNADATSGTIVALKCETDFVAKNEDFVKFTQSILDLAVEKQCANLNELLSTELDGSTVEAKVTEQSGVIGEKIELAQVETIQAEQATAYVHPGNTLATLIGLNKKDVDKQVGKDVAMQVAAMSPIAIDETNVPQNIIDEELKIAKEKARNEGKPDAMLDKIAQGRLGKFLKENTLLNQAYIKDNKKSVKKYLQEIDKDLTVVKMKRLSIKN